MTIGKKGNRLPTTLQNNMGDGIVEKGNWEGIYLIAWDFADECSGKKCNLYEKCVYKDYTQMKKKKGTPGASSKCMLQQRYLKNVLYAIMEKMKKKREMTQENVIKLGFHMLPLYAQLFKFKIYEYDHRELVYISEKGTPKVHPVYKEIREIVKTIENVWKGIGGEGSGKRGNKASAEVGDDAYVDAMYEVMGEEPPVEEARVEEDDGKGVAMDFDSVGIPDEKPKRTKDESSNNKRKTQTKAYKNRPSVKKTRKRRS